MEYRGITLLGLGPGDPDLLTRRAWKVLESADEIYLRTRHHPAVEYLPGHLVVHSMDYLYEEGQTFEDVYRRIVEQILELGQRPQGVIYAVPGHPFIAESTGVEILRRAQQLSIPINVVEGVSFIGPTFSALGKDPFPQVSLVDALELAAGHVPCFPPDSPALIAQLYSKEVASDVKLTLMSVYPDDHPVRLVHAAGTPQEFVEDLALHQIDQNPRMGLLSTLYVPALEQGSSFETFQEIIAHLRAPDGCPWDREQTHRSLRPHLLEETYEALAAMDANDDQAMSEELGDLLLQIVLHAQIASETGGFSMTDVVRGIHHKIVRRHPHVFGDVDLQDVGGVLANWERLKAAERVEKGQGEASLLDGVALALPALTQAEQIQLRAARVGFDWPEIQGVVDKVQEEWQEVLKASEAERSDEIGDLLFAVVNLARWYKVEPESALREANIRFRRRFRYIENIAREQGVAVSKLSLGELERLWQKAKLQ
jgi:tetrapyrrole methylase family protein/MazG family protein